MPKLIMARFSAGEKVPRDILHDRKNYSSEGKIEVAFRGFKGIMVPAVPSGSSKVTGSQA
jgi:hypothetical protein